MHVACTQQRSLQVEMPMPCVIHPRIVFPLSDVCCRPPVDTIEGPARSRTPSFVPEPRKGRPAPLRSRWARRREWLFFLLSFAKFFGGGRRIQAGWSYGRWREARGGVGRKEETLPVMVGARRCGWPAGCLWVCWWVWTSFDMSDGSRENIPAREKSQDDERGW